MFYASPLSRSTCCSPRWFLLISCVIVHVCIFAPLRDTLFLASPVPMLSHLLRQSVVLQFLWPLLWSQFLPALQRITQHTQDDDSKFDIVFIVKKEKINKRGFRQSGTLGDFSGADLVHFPVPLL